MPVLKVKKNGVWEDIMGGSNSGSLNGGNADTLDGYHATHFATASDAEAMQLDIDGLQIDVTDLATKVGSKSVSDQIASAISDKADSSHTHDDRYYTESEIDTKLANLTVSGGSVNAENVVGLDTFIDEKLSNLDYASSSHSHNTATSSSSGFMSSTDKARLDSIYTTVNSHTSSISSLQTTVNSHTTDISDLEAKVGNSTVSDQINTAISNISTSKTLLQHFTEENMVLTVLQYGDTLPSPGTPGRIFFKKVSN